MSGRAKIKCFQYDENGNYLRSFDSIAEVREKYYFDIEGKFPFFVEKNYQKLPDGTFIANYRIGKEGLLKQERINNCVFCSDRKLKVEKEIEVYNLKGERVAEFKNPLIASLLFEVDLNIIFSKLRSSKKSQTIGRFANLIFKYKP